MSASDPNQRLYLRSLNKDGEFWFVCMDVCALLDIPRRTLDRLDRLFIQRILCGSSHVLAVNLPGVVSLIGLAGLIPADDDAPYVERFMLTRGGNKVQGLEAPRPDSVALQGMSRLLLALRNGMKKRVLPRYAPPSRPWLEKEQQALISLGLPEGTPLKNAHIRPEKAD